MNKNSKLQNRTPCVGIWWYTDKGEVWARFIPTRLAKVDPTGEYLTLGSFIDLDKAWKQIVEENAENPEQLIHEDYRIFQHGSVEYNRYTQVYEIACDATIIHDKEFQETIVPYFGLQGNIYEFVLRIY